MGTDIHFHVERKGPNGWERAEAFKPNPYFGRWGDEPEFVRDEWYGDRNYPLFGVLADVRNGHGFAGIKIGEPVVPISDPRGLPEDTTLTAEETEWGHSHTWLGLNELLAVDWFGNRKTHTGVVDPKNFYQWKHWGKPEEWFGDISGPNIVHVDNDEMTRQIEAGEVYTPWTQKLWKEKHPGETPPARYGIDYRTYTQIAWSESWADACSGFLPVIVRMVHEAHKRDLKTTDVRAVFFFDS